MTPPVPTPFHISFAQSEIDRMMAKVRSHRLPSAPIVPGVKWEYGIDLDWLKALKKTWEEKWSWKKTEKELNRFPHFRVDIEDLSIHFIHVKSKHPRAIPIVLWQEWPSSFLDFDVVVPSLPGFTFSSPPTRSWAAADTSRVYSTLIVDVLGYKTYGAVGGDLGTRVLTGLLQNHSSNVKAAHYTMLFGLPPASFLDYLPLPTFLVDWYKKRKGGRSTSRRSLWPMGWDTRRFSRRGRRPLELLFTTTRSESSPTSEISFTSGLIPWLPTLPLSSLPTTSSLKLLSTISPTASTPVYCSFFSILSLIFVRRVDALDSDSHPSSSSSFFLPRPYHDCAGNRHVAAIPYNVKAPIGYSSNPWDIHHFPRRWFNQAVDNLVFHKLHASGGHSAAQDAPEDFLEDVREMMGKHFHRA
ncbi:Alpha/Beta hydrolase protein [Mrakia frigida]|uniref:epoxide hydrolase n=1 Tax=Mrakia frigida TaxID=29902 RepID=UPI003FCC17A2